jgi:hypothetical protein
MTDADGGAPSPAARAFVTFEPSATDEVIGSASACAAGSRSWLSVSGARVIGGRAAPWNETWSFSAGL